MDWLHHVANALFSLTDALLLPDLLVLLALAATALWLTGDTIGEAWGRLRAPADEAGGRRLPRTILVRRYQPLGRGSAAELARELRAAELEAARRLRTGQLLTRLGPALGLIGTLIPMGPALFGLAQGDLLGVAQNVRIAFATTVVGLLVGCVGFTLTVIRRGWYLADLAHLEYLVDLAAGERDATLA